jgi:hypothetical protein
MRVFGRARGGERKDEGGRMKDENRDQPQEGTERFVVADKKPRRATYVLNL